MRSWWTVPGADGGVLEMRTIPTPAPGEGQVLVAVAAAGVNRGELIARLLSRTDNPAARAAPSGVEFAGRIAALGPGVAGWSIGERVMGRAPASHADAVVVPARALLPIPPQFSDTEAACIPNVFVTAHDALITAARLQPGESVLVTAGSSGVGTAALQLAGLFGAGSIVATSRTPAKAAALEALGATTVVDTTDDGWVEGVRAASDGGAAVVIDQVGGRLFPGLLRAMALGGRYVSVGRNDGHQAPIDLDLLARRRLHLIGVTFRTRSPEEALGCSERFAADCLAAFGDGRLRPVLDRAFPLEELPAAHRYMLGDTQLGKIVLTE